MNLSKLLVYFETSPALRLLRSPNAAFIVDFLDQQFKRAGRITVPFSDLHAALIAYREAIQETDPEALRDKPENYLSGWCSSDTRWLHRFLEAGRNEPVYQLTPHTEDVFAFLDGVLEQDLGFVGTESRLRLVIETLADLVVKASDDPETRLAYLRDEKLRLENEIARIETEGLVTRYQPAQIRERFATAVSLLKQLQGDFRAVEEKFKEITQQVQQRQNEGRDTRGGILEFALDAEDVLKREDQGVSFHEFVRFILSPSQQDKLQTIIQQLMRIEELAEQAGGLGDRSTHGAFAACRGREGDAHEPAALGDAQTASRREGVPGPAACCGTAAGDHGVGGVTGLPSAQGHGWCGRGDEDRDCLAVCAHVLERTAAIRACGPHRA